MLRADADGRVAERPPVLRRAAEPGSGLQAIVDTEGQSDYPYQRFIYGKFDKRPDLQHPSVYVTYPASNSIFRSVDRLKLIEGIMEADPKKRGCNLQLKELLARGACLAIYPLHDDDELQTIQDRWLTPCDPPWAQPIVMVKDYFGEKVGMYFLFLGTYSTWLLGLLAKKPLLPPSSAFSS